MTSERFGFEFDPRYQAAGRLFGVTPRTAWLEVGAQRLEARFGPWQVSTPITNVVSAEITGPYSFLKTAGPARLAITDRGLTFATNGSQGVLIEFAEPVRGLDPMGLLRHPELTVTVRETERLVELLKRLRPQAMR
jgi:hypothetical protein